jgi:hypothetical protein
MRLLVKALPNPPQPFLQRPGELPRQLSAAWHTWRAWQADQPGACMHRKGTPLCRAPGEPELNLSAEERTDMALMFAFESLWPGVQAVVKATVDPEQLKIALYTSLSVYLGLLLLPEPTSKLAALAMTVTLMAYLGADTLFRVVEGYRQLQSDAQHARSFRELKIVGVRYGQVLGEQVGRVLVMVATAALGWTAHGVMKGPGLPGFGRAAQAFKAETRLDLSEVASQAQAMVVARPAVTVSLTPLAAYMATHGMEGSKAVRPSGADPASSHYRLERVEEWRKPRLTGDGRVLPYRGTRTPAEPIAILGRNRAGKTLRSGKDTLRFDKHGFAEFETQFETIIDDIHIGSGQHRLHFKAANQRLHDAIKANPSFAKQLGLSPDDVMQLPTSKDPPTGYTWHHHQDVGRMQLITRSAHDLAMPHTGGMSIWGGGYRAP